MKYGRLKKRSDRKKLRDKIGAIHLKILRHERGDRCEICQIPGNVSRFHIMPIGSYPKLEFVDENILLVHWMNNCQAHFLHHHAGSDDPRNIRTLRRIKELRGEDYRERLSEMNKFIGTHNELYLLAKLDEFRNRLGKYE